MDPQQLPLRDIHLPDPIIWWPPAPGWWLLLLFLGILTLLVFWMRQWAAKRRKDPKLIALRELEKLQTEYRQHPQMSHILVQKISTLLRRVCITIYPRAEVASLTGEAWLQFLDKAYPSPQFSQGKGRCLIEAPYRSNVEIDAEALLKLCHNWIQGVAPM